MQGFESRIRFLLKFMNSLKRIKIRKMENKPHSIKETETEFRDFITYKSRRIFLLGFKL